LLSFCLFDTPWGRTLTLPEQAKSPSEDPPKQFVELLARCERRLSGYVSTLVPDWHDADEVLQETKIRLWEQFSQYDASKDFGAWACTVAYYLALAQRKKSQRQHTRFSPQFFDMMAVEAGLISLEADARHIALMDCLETLDQPSRDLIAQYYVRGATIKSVAIRLGRSISGVQKAVARIRQKLQECIEWKLRREESV